MKSDREEELRKLIGRSRHRIERRVRAVRREGKKLLDWQTYVRHYPLGAVTTAVGAGLAAGLGGRWLKNRLGRDMLREAVRSAGGGLVKELVRRLFRSNAERGNEEIT
jgi:hypothetical protein